MKNKSGGFVWILAIIIVALLAGGGAYVALKKPSVSSTSELNTNAGETEQAAMQQNNTANVASGTTVRLEFPWSQYQSSLNIRAASTSTKLVGGTINVGGFGRATTVIGKNVNLGGSSKIGTVYAFNSLNFAADGRIETLYVESSTSLLIGRNATVGQKVVLSHNDLVTQAEAAAGASAQSTSVNAGVNVSTQGPTTGTSTSGKTNTTVTTPPITIIAGSFSGEWNGTYTSSPLVSAACKASGPVSLSISSTGAVTGYAEINGIKAPGTGKVDASGNLSGSWNYTGTNLTYTGKINNSSNTGSGNYQNALGCFGTFSVSR